MVLFYGLKLFKSIPSPSPLAPHCHHLLLILYIYDYIILIAVEALKNKIRGRQLGCIANVKNRKVILINILLFIHVCVLHGSCLVCEQPCIKCSCLWVQIGLYFYRIQTYCPSKSKHTPQRIWCLLSAYFHLVKLLDFLQVCPLKYVTQSLA